MSSQGDSLSTFLDSLKLLFPNQDGVWRSPSASNPAPIVSAIVFVAQNDYTSACDVYLHELNLIEESNLAERLKWTRKFRDCLFRVGVLYGQAKYISTMLRWNELAPPELIETAPMRDFTRDIGEMTKQGEKFLRKTFGLAAELTIAKLSSVHPDYYNYAIGHTYGTIYAALPDVVTPVEMSYCFISALLATDCGMQLEWHLKGALENGATVYEANAVREMAIKTIKWCHEQRLRFEADKAVAIDTTPKLAHDGTIVAGDIQN